MYVHNAATQHMRMQSVTHDCWMLQASLTAVELDSVEGFQAASDAGFMLAVLASTGIAASDVPLNDTWAVHTLHICARAGSEEAQLALAHRYYLGHGVPKSCHEGVRCFSCLCTSICACSLLHNVATPFTVLRTAHALFVQKSISC